MSWGAWAGICYPLLFAACNILLLPGGVLAVGGGFFFGLWWGFLIVFAGNIVSTAISFSLSRFVAQRWFRRKLSANPTLRALGPAVERESWKIISLEPDCIPLFPHQPAELLLWADTNTVWHLYASGRPSVVCLGLFFYAYVGTLGQLRQCGSMRGKSYPRALEYLDLGWRVRHNSVAIG
jgi:uncharacterized membrane protein YdjX (TVP38/TMEM64 family)